MKRELEERIQIIGHQLWAEMQSQSTTAGQGWINRLIVQLMADSQFRLQALRFVDTASVLVDDIEMVRHFREYFSDMDEGQLPQLLAWGIRRSTKLSLPTLVAPVIRAAVRRVAHRFIAGEDVKGALKAAGQLQGRGINASLDLLGEATVSEAEAVRYQQAYLNLIEGVSRATPRFVDLNLSVKVSSLFSQISPVDSDGSIMVLAERLRPICHAAMAAGISITLDMEQYDYKAIVLQLFKQLAMEEAFREWDGLGLAIQAYLRDTDVDIADLTEWVEKRGSPIMLRLVRGAYWDMETVVARQQGWPVPVWTSKSDTDACYERCLVQLFASPMIRPAVATHNFRSLACAIALAESTDRAREEYEFQMLYGMSDALEPLITNQAMNLRLYLPFGELLPGIAYLVRRLLENSSDQSILPLMPNLDIGQILLPPEVSHEDSPAMDGGFINQPLRRFVHRKERESFQTALQKVEEQLGKTYPLNLPGHIALQEQVINSTNPANPDELVGQVQSAGPDDAEMALRHAEAGIKVWSSLSLTDRAAYLDRVGEMLTQRRDQFAAWQVKEAGKCWTEADADVAEAIDFLHYYAERARELDRRHNYSLPGEDNTLTYHALGVGVILPPWNFPLAIPVGMLSAAIVCGNSVILKPASQTPVIAWHFCKLLQEAGLPDGVVTCLPGSGAEIGEALVRDPRTHFVAFTGSREVGLHLHQIMSLQSETQRHVKRLIAEMGGKNAIIIDTDADLDDAVVGVIESAFGYQGQKCSACSRVICVGDIHDGFVRRLIEAARSLRMGDPLIPGNRFGPVISSEALRRIWQVIEEAKITAKPVFIGELSSTGGHFVPPVIFSEVEEESPLAQEEIFGPVVSVFRAKDFDEALRIANSTSYALTGGIYSRLPSHLEQATRDFMVGNLYINRKITRAMVKRQPFGGFKLSGMGSKAGGQDYLLQFLNARNVTENTLRRGFAPDIITSGEE